MFHIIFGFYWYIHKIMVRDIFPKIYLNPIRTGPGTSILRTWGPRRPYTFSQKWLLPTARNRFIIDISIVQRCCGGGGGRPKGGGEPNTTPKPPWGHFRGAEGASKMGKIVLFHRKKINIWEENPRFLRKFSKFFFKLSFWWEKNFILKFFPFFFKFWMNAYER